jgi:hypothetical protein
MNYLGGILSDNIGNPASSRRQIPSGSLNTVEDALQTLCVGTAAHDRMLSLSVLLTAKCAAVSRI